MKDINEFKGAYYFLSNFYEAPFVYDGLTYLNNEAAFQGAKLQSDTYQCPKTGLTRLDFTQMAPNVAKQYGRRVQLREDWESIKIDVMTEIVRQKFRCNPALRHKLLLTKGAKLYEGNTWRDLYWGVDARTRKGQNHLGQILMQVREEFANESNE